MQDFSAEFIAALGRIAAFDPETTEIVALSLRVSLLSTLISSLLGLTAGAFIAVMRFRGRQAIILFLNAMMALPPVVVGLFVYLMLSRAGPFGWMGLLYTPTAMVTAQTILITPIIAALSRQILEDMHEEYSELFQSMRMSAIERMKSTLWDSRFSLLTVSLAGFGRSIAEVGAVIIVGGNIEHATRVMTTAIALETSKGNLSLAMALGILLLAIALIVNGLVSSLRLSALRAGYA